MQWAVSSGADLGSASETKSCWPSEVELHDQSKSSVGGVLKWVLEAFGFLKLKYAFSHILETLFLSFMTAILTPKTDKNSTLINFRYFMLLHPLQI